MKIQAHLDIDLVALETQDDITLMLDLTAPISDMAKDRPGQAVQIVLDRSGSMEGQPLEAAKNSILLLLDRLSPQDSFGLVGFDNTALVFAPLRPLADIDLRSLRIAIRAIRSGGNTDISAGYLLGLRELNRVQASGGSTLMLISDGHANAGEQSPEFFSQIAQSSAQSKITTSTIGLGVGYDESILEAAAQGGGGTHRFANTIDEAVGAIAAVVEDLLDKSIVNAVLRITPLAGVQGAPKIELLQRLPYWQDGSDYVVQLGDLYAGENRRFVFSLEIPQIADLGFCTIANITLEYLDLALRQEYSVMMPVTVNVVPQDVANNRVPNPIVRAERLILESQAEKVLATDEIKTGNGKDASNRLKEVAGKLRREASLLPVTDERSAESLNIMMTEASAMEALAVDAEFERPEYSSKRMTESYSNKTRSRNFRNQSEPTSTEEESN